MIACKCGEVFRTVDHLLRCRLLAKECNYIWGSPISSERPSNRVCTMLVTDNLTFDDGLDKKNIAIFNYVSDVNKDWTCKDKDKDQAYKDQAYKDQDKD